LARSLSAVLQSWRGLQTCQRRKQVLAISSIEGSIMVYNSSIIISHRHSSILLIVVQLWKRCCVRLVDNRATGSKKDVISCHLHTGLAAPRTHLWARSEKLEPHLLALHSLLQSFISFHLSTPSSSALLRKV